MEEINYRKIAQLIEQIIENYTSKIKEIISKREIRLLTESALYMTKTTLAPHDFFNSGKVERCSDELFIKDFNRPTILFTDLKGSTNILKECERLGITCLYTGYIYYSSRLLADILDFVNGKIVEITGDGTYSIIEEINDNKINRVLDAFYDTYNLNNIKDELYEYIHLVGELPYNLNQLHNCMEANNRDIRFRNFIFCIFTRFNIEINKFLEMRAIDVSFFTRVGCKKGPCKITRFNIEKHVFVDKLIGSTVNDAAHEAMGKH